MGKTADRYSEGASKSSVTIACGETFLSVGGSTLGSSAHWIFVSLGNKLLLHIL